MNLSEFGGIQNVHNESSTLDQNVANWSLNEESNFMSDEEFYNNLRRKMELTATTIAILGLVANAFVLLVMLKTKKIRTNSF